MSSSTSFQYDVAIVGGGPAGVSCAITVAQKGYKVVIVDKKSRDKIGDKTCGDAIDKAGLERVVEAINIPYPKDKALSDPIKKMSVAAQNAAQKLTLDAPGFVVDRLEYGQVLLDYAEKAGVKIISNAPVREILVEDIDSKKFVKGFSYTKNNEVHQVTAKFTIDASGAYAAIRKVLPDEMLIDGLKAQLDDTELWPTYREIVTLNDDVPDHNWPQEILLLFSDDFPPPGYFWIFTKGPRELNFGIGWQKNQDLGKLKERYQEELSKYLKPNQYTVRKRGGGQIPFRPPFDSNVFNGGAIIGDAGCLVHPLTAEGHAPALNSGMILGQALVEALESNQRERIALWDYNVRIANHYGRKHIEAYIMKEFLSNIRANGLEYVIRKKVFKEEELNLVFSGANLELSTLDMLKRLIILLPRPKILLGLGSILRKLNIAKKLYNNYPTDPSQLSEWRKLRNTKLHVKF